MKHKINVCKKIYFCCVKFMLVSVEGFIVSMPGLNDI